MLENGLHKQTRCKKGKLVRRSPYPTMDEALFEGLHEWLDVMCGGRSPDAPTGVYRCNSSDRVVTSLRRPKYARGCL